MAWHGLALNLHLLLADYMAFRIPDLEASVIIHVRTGYER